MPRLDGTGPEGKGPKTGRKQGKCISTEVQKETITEETNFFPRKNFGQRNGRR